MAGCRSVASLPGGWRDPGRALPGVSTGRAGGAGRPRARRAPAAPARPLAETEECERALVDFVASQDIALRKLLRLHQALAGPGTPAPLPPPPSTGRAALRLRLRQELTALRRARPGALAAGLLRALQAARLPGLERAVREHLLPAAR